MHWVPTGTASFTPLMLVSRLSKPHSLARNLRPAVPMLLHQLLQPLVFLLCPLLSADVGVDAVAPALRALLPCLAADVLGNLSPAVAILRLRQGGGSTEEDGWEGR